MSALTSEEREAIIESETLRCEIRATLEKPQQKSSLAFLNSPFVVSVVGGIVLVFLTSNVQNRVEATKMNLAKRNLVFEREYAIYTEAADDFPNSIQNIANAKIELHNISDSEARIKVAKEKISEISNDSSKSDELGAELTRLRDELTNLEKKLDESETKRNFLILENLKYAKPSTLMRKIESASNDPVISQLIARIDDNLRKLASNDLLVKNSEDSPTAVMDIVQCIGADYDQMLVKYYELIHSRYNDSKSN